MIHPHEGKVIVYSPFISPRLHGNDPEVWLKEEIARCKNRDILNGLTRIKFEHGPLRENGEHRFIKAVYQ